jgi:hypothetical protein
LLAALAAQVQELCLRDVIGEEQPGQRAAGAGDDNPAHLGVMHPVHQDR